MSFREGGMSSTLKLRSSMLTFSFPELLLHLLFIPLILAFILCFMCVLCVCTFLKHLEIKGKS